MVPEAAPSRTVSKALDVLDCLGREQRPLSASEVARLCGLSRPTAYRLLGTLLMHGYVVHEPNAEAKYRLGYKILELSRSLLANVELRQQALPYLQELSRSADETAYLAVLDRGAVVYVEKVESMQAVRMHCEVGTRNPVHSTALGKAILAYMDPGERAAILGKGPLEARAPHTITDRGELEVHLEQVRQQGFVIDDVENEEGIRCVAAPVFDHSGEVIGAISLSGPAYRLSLERAHQVAGEVKATALAVSKEMGYIAQGKA